MELCYYILHCTFRVHTVICTEWVDKGKFYLYKKVQEHKRKEHKGYK